MANTYSHQFVEDYMEIIAGYRQPDGKSNTNIFSICEPIISLARYDQKVVPSLAAQSYGGSGYTDKQAKLALDLVLKYERQLLKFNLDLSPLKINPAYRLPFRSIDRSTRIWVEGDTIKIKFPYNTKLIEQIKEMSKESKGQVRYDREEHIQKADLTEWNLNWFYAFAKGNDFEIDRSVEDLMRLLLAEESKSYAIELCYDSDKIWVSGAADSLNEYVADQLGGWSPENIIRLIDWAPILGYTINKEISNQVIAEFGNRFYSLCANRQLKVDSSTSKNLIRDIVNYARNTERFPIFVFEPDLSGRLFTEFDQFFPDQIHSLDSRSEIDYTAPVIYTNKIPRKPIDRIPLLVSSAGMLHGGDRQIWIQNAEKIVYFSKEVYNNTVKGSTVCKLD